MGMGSSRGNGPRGLVADINVTPLVDVMLVLLIIFMVTAPMMTQGINVDLPPTTTNELRQKEDSHVVSVKSKGEIYFGEINLGQFDKAQPQLHEKLAKIFAEKGKEEIILINADKNVVYGVVVSIMDDIKTIGFTKIGMVTNPPEEKK